MALRSQSAAVAANGSQRTTIALSALLFAIFLICEAGLAKAALLYDTAHDIRHIHGFPSH